MRGEQVAYTIGLGRNGRLERAIAGLQSAAETQSQQQGGAKVSLAGETSY